MKTIITGTVEFADIEAIREAVELSAFEITELVSGAARRVDKLGEEWAKNNNVPVRLFGANWYDLSSPDALIKSRANGRGYDTKAGLRRDRQMVDYAEGVIAVWDGYSVGTKNLIRLCKEKGLKVFVYGRPQRGMEETETPEWMSLVTNHRTATRELDNRLALQWQQERRRNSFRASKNILIALCDKGEWIKEPAERFRVACPNCNTFADIESLIKVNNEARVAYETAKAKYLQAKAEQEHDQNRS